MLQKDNITLMNRIINREFAKEVIKVLKKNHGELTQVQIIRKSKVLQPYVSEVLSDLHKAGIVEKNRSGQFTYFLFDDDKYQELLKVWEFLDAPLPDLIKKIVELPKTEFV